MGGAGRDVFVFGGRDGRDVIADFLPGIDQLALSGRFDPRLSQTDAGLRVDFGETRVVLDGLTPKDVAGLDLFG